MPKKIKDRGSAINLDEYAVVGTHWIVLYALNIIYYDSFGVEHIPKEFKSNQTISRLNEINKINDYFNAEIQERKIMSKEISKYIATLDYFDKTPIVLSATNGGISIISLASIIGAPVGIASLSFSFTC